MFSWHAMGWAGNGNIREFASIDFDTLMAGSRAEQPNTLLQYAISPCMRSHSHTHTDTYTKNPLRWARTVLATARFYFFYFYRMVDRHTHTHTHTHRAGVFSSFSVFLRREGGNGGFVLGISLFLLHKSNFVTFRPPHQRAIYRWE